MMKLALAPDQDGYTINWSQSTISTKLDGGPSRMRRDFLNAPVNVTCVWTCDAKEFEYLKTFWRVTKNGSEPFIMDLLVSSPMLTQHVCRFVPNTFRVTDIKENNVFKVRATIEAEPLAEDDAFDEGLVTSFEAFGLEASESYQLLARLVNVDMPANIK